MRFFPGCKCCGCPAGKCCKHGADLGDTIHMTVTDPDGVCPSAVGTYPMTYTLTGLGFEWQTGTLPSGRILSMREICTAPGGNMILDISPDGSTTTIPLAACGPFHASGRLGSALFGFGCAGTLQVDITA